MDEFHGRASVRIDAAPQAVFDVITDVDRLPEWNGAIEAVIERTFDRRVLGGPLRKRQLAREVPKSLTAMASAVMATETR